MVLELTTDENECDKCSNQCAKPLLCAHVFVIAQQYVVAMQVRDIFQWKVWKTNLVKS